MPTVAPRRSPWRTALDVLGALAAPLAYATARPPGAAGGRAAAPGAVPAAGSPPARPSARAAGVRHLARTGVLAIAVLVGLPAQPVIGQTRPAPALAWHSCGADAPPALECAELEVPLDYDVPQGASITIGLNRLPATDPARRIGSLIFNPGGPGGAATVFVGLEAAGRRVFSPALRERFDVIGLDPRGVGASTPIRCDPAIWNERVSRFPRSQPEFDALVAHNQALGESCLRLTGPLLGHVDTVSVARDMESVRAALGDGMLNYLGLSYGTDVGHTYAALFPRHIRAMALDGALDHSLAPVAMLVDEAAAHERALGRFARWCAATPSCALHGQDVEALYDDLVRRAEATPLPAPKCAETGACRPTVTGDELRLNAQEYFLFRNGALGGVFPGWAELATALSGARAGDASGLSSPVAKDETFGDFAALAIECSDWVSPLTRFENIAAADLLVRAFAPHTRGASQAWTVQAGCPGWPLAAPNPPRSLVVRGAPPILIVNATYDPSTAYPWAVGMFHQIEGSVLLTREGDGHTSYWLVGPSRTREAIDAYLISGALPPPNTVYPD